jgi:hypothetical protein
LGIRLPYSDITDLESRGWDNDSELGTNGMHVQGFEIGKMQGASRAFHFLINTSNGQHPKSKHH